MKTVRKKGYKQLVLLTLAAILLLEAVPISSAHAVTQQEPAYYEEILDYTKEYPNYRQYLQTVSSESDGVSQVVISATDYLYCRDMTPQIKSDFNGKPGDSLYTEESGLLEYAFTVEKAGLYRIALEYYPVEGKSAAIQRSFFIDGKLPYQELALVEFARTWGNETDQWLKDNQGNDIKPGQIEKPVWTVSECFDVEGYVSEPLSVYLSEGEHSLTIVSRREPMVLHQILLYQGREVQSYEEVMAGKDTTQTLEPGYQEIQAENAVRKSSPMLYPQQDQSSPAIAPYSPKLLLNNSIGGETSWNTCGQWVEWSFQVEQDGYYQLAVTRKQNFVKGVNVSRKITIDGEVPFREMESYPFGYVSDWTRETLSDEQGTPYLFYLEAGSHTLRMEVVMGELGTILERTQNTLTDLNAIYRKVICITGISPDSYRDYQIEDNFPELAQELVQCRDELNEVIEKLRAVAGMGSAGENTLLTMRDQLTDLSEDVETIGKYLGAFKTNINAVGTWIINTTPQPLQIDSLYIVVPGTQLPALKNSFWHKLIHELRRLFWSFFVDYNKVGNLATEDTDTEVITVWIGGGRDQANTIKELVDRDFTPKTGIGVNIMLVDMNTLLQATLAGQGPDVALQVSGDLPMNYGLREAAMDLTEVASPEELAEVKSWFRESAFAGLEYEGALYGLPETENCLMMFYRKDILRELGLDVPKTWDDVKVALGLLNNNQMTLGMMPSEQVFASMLYQKGGRYYTDDATASDLDSVVGLEAFKEFTQYYTDYKLDRETSLTQGFRNGEMPIIIADSSTYTTLQVSAPEIKGLWGFTVIPGTVKADGTVDSTAASSITASMIMNATDKPEASWAFLKWWNGAQAQSSYGIKMESIMGASARYMTANTQAFAMLPWPVQDYKALETQFAMVQGIPQVPGGYFTWRNVNNAFYRVVVSSEAEWMAPREALTEYVNYINAEITYKRKEFGMETAE